MEYLRQDYFLVLLRVVDEYRAQRLDKVFYHPEKFKITGESKLKKWARENSDFFNNLFEISDKFGVTVNVVTPSSDIWSRIQRIVEDKPERFTAENVKFLGNLINGSNIALARDELFNLIKILDSHCSSYADDCLEGLRFELGVSRESYNKIIASIQEYISEYVSGKLVGATANFLSYPFLRSRLLEPLLKLQAMYGDTFIIGPQALFDLKADNAAEFRFLETVLALEQEGVLKIIEVTCSEYWKTFHNFCNFKVRLEPGFKKFVGQPDLPQDVDLAPKNETVVMEKNKPVLQIFPTFDQTENTMTLGLTSGGSVKFEVAKKRNAYTSFLCFFLQARYQKNEGYGPFTQRQIEDAYMALYPGHEFKSERWLKDAIEALNKKISGALGINIRLITYSSATFQMEKRCIQTQ